MTDKRWILAPTEPTEEIVDAGARARVAVAHKMPQALTLMEYAAPRYMERDREGMSESYRAMLSAARLVEPAARELIIEAVAETRRKITRTETPRLPSDSLYADAIIAALTGGDE